MSEPIRNRIKSHRRIRAGDLIPHELNFRLHPQLQRAALKALYQEVGFARSLLAFEMPNGRLKLIDGHLRRDLDAEMEVDVEILDVNEEEARDLLLSIDPLAALAQTQEQLRDRLMEIAPAISHDLRAAWEATANAAVGPPYEPNKEGVPMGPEQWLVLITCRDEKHQIELLMRFQGEGLPCADVVVEVGGRSPEPQAQMGDG
jgi:hypothetical protein